MDKHPDEEDPTNRGPYFSSEAGECPLCGMKLKPIEELEWAQALLAAGGGSVAYTCPKHPHVFSESPGDCPVCRGKLEPFQALYTCRDPKHSAQTSDRQDDCPRCGEPMAVFRGPWLGEAMAKLNPSGEPPAPDASGDAVATKSGRGLPRDARFVCPMQECWQFSPTEGRCPTCGMKLKPIEQVAWAARLAKPASAKGRFVCPMHPDRASDEPGVCPICAMELLPRDRIVGLEDENSSVTRQVDYLMEHYLALQERFARDSTSEAARHALGLVEASEKLGDLLKGQDSPVEKDLLDQVAALHAAALRIRGADISNDRVQFVRLSAAMRTIIAYRRPDPARWPKLFIFHCPMSNADWIQSVEKKANPYYGFKMLDCGNLLETK